MDETPGEQLGPDVSRSWLHNRQVCIITMTGKTNHEVTHQWADVVAQTIQEWPVQHQIYLLLDFSDPLFVLTQPARSAIIKAFSSFSPDERANVAVAIHVGMSYLIARAVIPRARIPDSVNMRVFTGLGAALAWLESLLPKDEG